MIVSQARTAIALAISLVVCLTAFAIVDQCNADEPKNGDWKATVSARNCKYADEVWNKKHPDGFWQLEMELVYLGKNVIEISTNDLPWNWRYAQSTTIVAVPADSDIPLPHVLPAIGLPVGQTIRLEPKQVLKGAIHLGQFVGQLDETLKSSSIVVFWTWKLDASNRVGGWVEIPKSFERGRALGKHIEKGASAVVTEKQKQELRSLIDQLVFAEGNASKEPVISPGITDQSTAYRARFGRCQNAFKKLSEFKELAFPFLLEHLKDQRQSIPFRNHYLGQSVGDACYWIIYYQLQDRPRDYSSYGLSRKGRDGQDHEKPYWQGTPFDDAGGVAQWLETNKNLSYPEMQIKCLRWLLEKEKAIGAWDAEGYFVNILPLEIRILEHRQELGENVRQELNRLRRIKAEKLADAIPAELLPAKR